MIKHPSRGSRRRPAPEAGQQNPLRTVLFEEIADGYYQTDLEGRLLVVNTSLSRIIGAASPAEIIASTPQRFLDADTFSRLKQVARHVHETGEPAPTVECPIRRIDDEPRQLEISVALHRDADGAPVGYHGIVRDITERAMAAVALNKRFSQFALLQQVDVELNQTLVLDTVLSVALNAALLLSGADTGFVGLIEHERIQLARAIGGFPEPMIPLNTGIVARVIRNQHAEMVADVMSDPDYIADLSTTRAEIAIPLIAHSKVVGVLNLETSAPERFTSEAFEFTQLLAARVASAIENARLYETMQTQLAELRGLYTQVSDLEQLKTHMIRVAAHDLRSPLSIVASYTELLNEDLAQYYNDMDGMYINAIRQAVARMTQMTSDILSLERIAEHRDVTLMRVKLGNLLERTLKDMADNIRQKDHQTSLTVEPVAVYGDSSSCAKPSPTCWATPSNIRSPAGRSTPAFAATAIQRCWK
ncbi:MAG: GAF domain-containing protein, partial [Anaerolineae bacterium]|nr:GAF domain-containing protein [Anaerolineae bacterium]